MLRMAGMESKAVIKIRVHFNGSYSGVVAQNRTVQRRPQRRRQEIISQVRLLDAGAADGRDH